MLTFNHARAVRGAKFAVHFAAATMLSAATLAAAFAAARADGIAAGGCIGGRSTLNCVVRWGEASDPYVRTVPPPSDQERTHADEREQRWETRCKPAVMQDRYGVARYRYAAQGCDFGIIE